MPQTSIIPSSLPPNAPLSARFFKWVPAFDSLRRYSLGDARADLIAGLTVAAVALPQAMAYALIAGLPVEYGLYTAIVMTAVGALFDSSRQLINGPTNAISIAVLSVIGTIAAPDERIQAAVLLAFMVGSVQLAVAFMRLGDLSRYISHSVILGFTTGASVLLVLDQTKNLLGLTSVGDVHDHFLVRFWLTLTEGGAIHLPTMAVGVGAIVTTLLLRALKTRLGLRLAPELLIVVVGAAWCVSALGLEAQGVRVVGDIPAKLPSFTLPVFNAERMRDYATGALAVGVLGLLEAISMAKAIAAYTRQKLDINQQCVSEGLANVAGSFFQCFPGSGSLTRSAINQQAGAATQWSGVVSAIAVATTVVLFAPYARHVPRAALAGILMVTAFKMVDWHALRYHVRATRFDTALVVVTAISAVAISIEFCVLIGVFLSFMLAVPRVGQVLLTEFVVAADGGLHERLPDDDVCPKLLIFGLEGELFFGATASLERHLDTIVERSVNAKVVVLRMKRARNPDAVGLSQIDDFLTRMQINNVRVLMCGVRPDLAERLDAAGIAERLGDKHLFLEQPVRQTSTLLAIRAAYTLIDGPCETCPRRGGQPSEQRIYYAI